MIRPLRMGTVRGPTARWLLAALLSAIPGESLHAQSWGQYGVTIYRLPATFQFGNFLGGRINDRGQVPGEYWVTEGGISLRKLAVFTPGRGVTPLAPLGANAAGFEANAINDRGDIVGYALPPGDAFFHAFLYDGSSLRDLGSPGQFSISHDINNSGAVVGGAGGHVFLFDGSTMRDLGSLGPAPYPAATEAEAVNEAGQVVGYSALALGNLHAFLYDRGSMMDLGTLGGSSSMAWDINDAGRVVGWSYLASGLHGFYYDANSVGAQMQDLGALSPYGFSWAWSIDNSGRIVGEATSSGSDSALIWENNGSAYLPYTLSSILDRTDPGWSFSTATNISGNGRYIFAVGTDPEGQRGAVLLQQNDAPGNVTPEPSTLILFATGVFGLVGGVSRRRRRLAATR